MTATYINQLVILRPHLDKPEETIDLTQHSEKSIKSELQKCFGGDHLYKRKPVIYDGKICDTYSHRRKIGLPVNRLASDTCDCKLHGTVAIHYYIDKTQ
jgi:hypothetical protein